MTDLAIRNVRVLDGSGGPAREGDVGIEDGRISAVGDVGTARREIDGGGACLAPGFIDTHAHDDGAFFRHPGMEFKLAQGVTTVVSGNCGFSAIPADPAQDSVAASGGILAGLEGEFTDLNGYFTAVLERRPAINNLMLVGHNTVRTLAMGMAKRAPTAAELADMRGHVERALEQGACGFSTGLIYRPGRWSDTEEVIELARLAQPFGALYTTHMRNEGDHLLAAVDETLRIGRDAGVHAHISHHKSAGPANWGKVRDSLAKVDAALAAGQAVTLDVYPYTAGSGRMIEYFDLDNPSRELAEVIRIASCPAFREYEGRMLKDIAADLGMDVTQAVKHVLTAPKGDRTICIQFIIDEADMETNLAHADMMVGSDGIPDLRGTPASAAVRNVSARARPLRARASRADPGGSRAAHDVAAGRDLRPRAPRPHRGRLLGRPGAVRSRHRTGHGHLRRSQARAGRHPPGDGERRGGIPRRRAHGRRPRQDAALPASGLRGHRGMSQRALRPWHGPTTSPSSFAPTPTRRSRPATCRHRWRGRSPAPASTVSRRPPGAAARPPIR